MITLLEFHQSTPRRERCRSVSRHVDVVSCRNFSSRVARLRLFEKYPHLNNTNLWKFHRKTSLIRWDSDDPKTRFCGIRKVGVDRFREGETNWNSECIIFTLPAMSQSSFTENHRFCEKLWPSECFLEKRYCRSATWRRKNLKKNIFYNPQGLTELFPKFYDCSLTYQRVIVPRVSETRIFHVKSDEKNFVSKGV